MTILSVALISHPKKTLQMSPCDFNCLGAGQCVFATAAACTPDLLASNNFTSDSSQGFTFDANLAESLSFEECGCRCTNFPTTSSTGRFFSDPTILSANCANYKPFAAALGWLNIAVAVACLAYSFKIAVYMLRHEKGITDPSDKGKMASFFLHVRSALFSLHTIVYCILTNVQDVPLDSNMAFALSRIVIGSQVMGSTVTITYLWTKLLPMKIMRNEPIMRFVEFVKNHRGKIEAVIFLCFGVAAVMVVQDEFKLAVQIWNTTIIVVCWLPICFITAISVTLYKKMLPDQNIVSEWGFAKGAVKLFTQGGGSVKEQPDAAKEKFSAVVFKLRFSIVIVAVIGGGANLFSAALAFVPVTDVMPDILDSFLIFCALFFFLAMEYVFSPIRMAKAVANAKAVSEHHHSTVENDYETPARAPAARSAKIAPAT